MHTAPTPLEDPLNSFVRPASRKIGERDDEPEEAAPLRRRNTRAKRCRPTWLLKKEGGLSVDVKSPLFVVFLGTEGNRRTDVIGLRTANPDTHVIQRL